MALLGFKLVIPFFCLPLTICNTTGIVRERLHTVAEEKVRKKKKIKPTKKTASQQLGFEPTDSAS